MDGTNLASPNTDTLMSLRWGQVITRRGYVFLPRTTRLGIVVWAVVGHEPVIKEIESRG